MVRSIDVGHWIVDALMKNNVKETMKARLFLLWSENHNI
jgi:hypothetical protein